MMKKDKQGFTLLEMVLVLAIITTMAGVLYPVSRQGMRGMTLQYTAQAFAGELLRARLLALTENSAIVVRVTQKAQSYQLLSAVDQSCLRGPERFLDKTISFKQIPSREVVFHPWGTAAPAGSYLLGSAAGRINVVVSLTGRVRIERVKS